MLKKSLSYPSKLPHYINSYIGCTSSRFQSGLVKTAANCYNNQRARCYTKTNPRFKDNGEKGIQVLYSKRDFIAWYLHHINLYKGSNPSVGRIDHSKSYSFDNIRIESLEDNSMERIQRCGTTKERRAIKIIDYVSGKLIKIVPSILDAERETGVLSNHISKYCTGKLGKSKSGFTFRYENETDNDNVKDFKYKEVRRLKSEIVICDAKTLEQIYIAKTSKEIKYLTGINATHVSRHCRGEIKSSTKGYTLRYWSGDEYKFYSL